MPDESPVEEIGLTLSGGGVRALLYGLGALRAVVAACERRPGSHLRLLVGVSGGAIGAAFAASRLDLSKASLADYDAQVLRPAAWTITRRSLMFSRWYLWAVLAAALGLVGAGGLVAVTAGFLPWPARVAVGVTGVAAAALVLALRGAAIERSMRDTLFGGDSRLADIKGSTHLILQATDLASGEATYLTSRGISSWRWGDADAGDLTLVHAARAAATFPVVFGPLRLPSPPFTGGHDGSPPKTLSLVDGGIYDNMGSEWLINRAGPAVCRIVVNASQNLPRHDSIYGIPLIGDVLTLLRERDIQYDATTAPRRRLLNRLVQDSPAGGTTVAIDKNIREWLEKFTGKNDDWSRRANELLGVMKSVAEPGVWERWPSTNPAVATSLGKLSHKTARDLVCAGYLATAVQMHVLKDWPPPETVNPDQLMPWLGT